MIPCKFGFVILLCIIFQSNGNDCTIHECEQPEQKDTLEENLTMITTLPSCIMARNYDGLSFSIVLENNVYQSCSWIFANDFLDSNCNCVDYNRINADGTSPFNQENIFTSFAPCTNRSSTRIGVKETTCVMNDGRNYNSIVFKSISFNDWFVSLQCDGKYTKGFHIRVQLCNTTFGQSENLVRPNVDLNGNKRSYNATGSFRCNNGETLFHSNGTLVQNKSTQCLATAEWKDQNDLECRKDPPHRLEQNPCEWILNEYGSCRIEFFSNPNATFVSLFRNGIDITNSSNHSLSVEKNHIHVFILEVSQTTEINGGNYRLVVERNMSHYTISFSINVNSKSPILLIIIVSLVVLLIITIITFVIVFWKRQKTRNKSDYKIQSSVREMKANELYGTTEIQSNKVPSDKEMKLNELYVSTEKLVDRDEDKAKNHTKPETGSTIEAENGVPNKKKKTKKTKKSSEYETRSNELYNTSDMQNNKEGTEREMRSNQLYETAEMYNNNDTTADKTQQAANDKVAEVSYGVVNKKKKPQSSYNNHDRISASNQTPECGTSYSIVKKSQNKAKKDAEIKDK